MIISSGAEFTKLYSPSPYHRLQADAFLNGHLYLADSIYKTRHDLAWHAGYVHQVWGLGVGMWLVPFEAIWRLFGQKWFPDRMALCVAFALIAFYAASTADRLRILYRNRRFGMGVAALIAFCPSIWALIRGPGLVYEETSLYACLVSLGILVALIRVACFGKRCDYLICAALSAMSPLVRPTHGIYGLLGIVVCSAILLVRRRMFATVVFGGVVFVAGLVLLAVTNWVRFGSIMEFGHRLTTTPGLIVFMTRIDNPMHDASAGDAAKELIGELFFLYHPRNNPKITTSPWEASYARWRDPCVTTFDLSWAIICAAGIVGSTSWIAMKKGKSAVLQEFFSRPGTTLVFGVLVWAGISTVVLFRFYLYFPNLSARYLLDFAPAFTGFGILVWIFLSYFLHDAALGLLAAWLACEIASTESSVLPVPPQTRNEILTMLPAANGRKISDCMGSYASDNCPKETQIAYNGYGWDCKSEEAGSVVILAVDRPQFVELLVSNRLDQITHPKRSDFYRAMIDAQFLNLRSVTQEGELLRVRFDVPESIQHHAGDELLFLCFSKGFDDEDRDSNRMLRSVRWR